MKQFNVTGMSCASCQAHVEKAVSEVKGVSSCTVSLITGTMNVEGNASESEIIAAVKKAGYGAESKDASSKDEDFILPADKEIPPLKRRLFISLGFLIVLMYISMGHNMAHFPLPAFMENPVVTGFIQMAFSAVILVINRKFFTSGYRSLFHLAPNMDTLVALGSTAAFGYSVAELIMMISASDPEILQHYLYNLYFEAAAMIPCLITVGKLLEAVSKGRTGNALKELILLAPKKATLITDEGEKEVDISEVKVGDIFAVRPGENIPVDGEIIHGQSAVNESALTGESIPADKGEGDKISAATTNISGYIEARATRVGEDTTLSQIIKLVSDAAATKAPIARIADKVSYVFVPVVMGIALITFIIWLITGATFTFAIARAISVLVISCPCALGLATPVAIMAGNGVGARCGILFKSAVSEEMTGKTDIVVLDKTGTITKGMPEVTDVIPAKDTSAEELITFACSVERLSEHPLAGAIVRYASAAYAGCEPVEVEKFKNLPGNGIEAYYSGEKVTAGSYKYISNLLNEKTFPERAEELSKEGKSVLAFAKGSTFLGIIAVADTVKEDSKEAITQMKNMGLEVIMLTGDNENTAAAIGNSVGTSRIIAGVLPDGKDAVIRKLKREGRVMMVGDGINDAPALTRADIGAAIGAGTDVAIEAADIVLVKSGLLDAAAAIRLSRRILRNIKQNLFWAFFYNLICIPLAAGFYQAIFGWTWEMNPMIGAACMCISSFTVCMNALRLNLVKVYDPSHDRKKKKTKMKEQSIMTKTMKIEGMMCGHCEMTVKKALEAIDGVSVEEVSHEKGIAVVEIEGNVSDDVLTKAVTDKDYEVISID